MRSILPVHIRCATALFFAGFFVSGCSSPGSDSGVYHTGTESGIADSDATDAAGDDDGVSTRVDFDITVPAYVSDALQVRLVWGEKDVAAQWVGDEQWSASVELPTYTEHLLEVTFYDRNGGITLASLEKVFRTGMNAAESFQITADQFDTERWDDDADGTSNLAELIAGTSPDDAMEIDLRESFAEPDKIAILGRSSFFYESSTPRQRPYHEHTEDYQPFVQDPYTIEIATAFTVDLDESGSGSYSDTYRSWEYSNVHVESKVATRSNIDKVITWEGINEFSDSSAALVENFEFSTRTWAIDNQTRHQQGKVNRNKNGDWSGGNFQISITYSLIGKVVSASSLCEPVTGTVTYQSNDDNYSIEGSAITTTTISKQIGDQYWKVGVSNAAGQLIDTYLVWDIGTGFYCDFADL